MNTITPFSSPPPTRKDPVNFDDRGDIFLSELKRLGDELPPVITDINSAVDNVTSLSSSVTALSNSVFSTANFKGLWSSLTGALNVPASVYHNLKFWVLKNDIANVAASQPGVSSDWIETLTKLLHVSYDSRNNLRLLTPATFDQVVVEGLGLFTWYSGSTEIDDDMTCFATASGRWLLEACSPDVVGSLAEQQFADIERKATVAKDFVDKNITKSVFLDQVTVAIDSQVYFEVYVYGVEKGDFVMSTPPTDIGNFTVMTYITKPNYVTIKVKNLSTSASSNTVAGTWVIGVIRRN